MWDDEGNYTGEPISAEEFAELLGKIKPHAGFQSEVLNRMVEARSSYLINVVLLFGPAHGQTMKVSGPPADELVWRETEPPVWAFNERPEGPPNPREFMQGLHRYRKEDEMESSNMEECVLYVHHENCCEKVIPEGKTTAEQFDPREHRQRMMPGGRYGHDMRFRDPNMYY